MSHHESMTHTAHYPRTMYLVWLDFRRSWAARVLQPWGCVSNLRGPGEKNKIFSYVY